MSLDLVSKARAGFRGGVVTPCSQAKAIFWGASCCHMMHTKCAVYKDLGKVWIFGLLVQKISYL